MYSNSYINSINNKPNILNLNKKSANRKNSSFNILSRVSAKQETRECPWSLASYPKN